jgi:hypothetical protein
LTRRIDGRGRRRLRRAGTSRPILNWLGDKDNLGTMSRARRTKEK